jgi:hypothetical protein
MRRPVTANGIALGPDSPLLDRARRKIAAQYEESDQVQLMALLVGPAVKGQDRQPGAGMTAKHPELSLLYAIPNSGAGGSRGMAGRMKAMGALRGMCDLCLPVPRGPFHGLYLELKRRGQRPRPEQARLHGDLAEQGYCVMHTTGVEEAMEVILGYLALPLARISARNVPRELTRSIPSIVERIARWRLQCYAMLRPQRTLRKP